MKPYLLSVYQPPGEPPAPEVLAEIMANVEAVRQEMAQAGVWVFSGGLDSPSTATVVRLHDEELLTTDGPFLESKEYLGGLTIVNASDLDEAMAWGSKVARATTLPIEVRPFYGDED
jgi:hypothetical protein